MACWSAVEQLAKMHGAIVSRNIVAVQKQWTYQLESDDRRRVYVGWLASRGRDCTVYAWDCTGWETTDRGLTTDQRGKYGCKKEKEVHYDKRSERNFLGLGV